MRAHSNPALRKKAGRRPISWYITWTVVDLIFISILSGFMFSLPIWRVKNVEVEGAHYIDPQKIISVAKVPLDVNTFLIDPVDVELRFSKFVQLKEVRFKRKLPGTVVIEIKERQPFAIVVIGNLSALIDEDGYILARNSLGTSIYRSEVGDMPLVRGLPKKSLIEGKRIDETELLFIKETLIRLSKSIPLNTAQIDVGNQDNIIVYIQDFIKVKLGNRNDIKKKIDVFADLYSKVKDKFTKISYIDVGSPDYPVVKYK